MPKLKDILLSLLYLEKLSFNNEVQIKTFPYEQELREFVSGKSTL